MNINGNEYVDEEFEHHYNNKKVGAICGNDREMICSKMKEYLDGK